MSIRPGVAACLRYHLSNQDINCEPTAVMDLPMVTITPLPNRGRTRDNGRDPNCRSIDHSSIQSQHRLGQAKK